MSTFTAEQICEKVGGRLSGDGSVEITGIAVLSEAGPTQISFLRDARFSAGLSSSNAGAVLVADGTELEDEFGRTLIFVKNADLALVEVLGLFAPSRPKPPAGVHASSVIDPTAEIDPQACIGPFCVIGARVKIGAGTLLHSGVTLMDDVSIGSDCEVFPNVVVREDCHVGHHSIIHSGVVIGADGFGYEPAADGASLVKVPHIGNVVVGNHVEIGAGTCIDRAKMTSTIIGDGTKIDNQCQIAHNCKIGRMCVICGQTGIAGSVELGDGVLIGGGVSVRDQVKIGSGAKIAATSGVATDVPAGATWAGVPARESSATLRELTALRNLPNLVKLHKRDLRDMREEAKSKES